MHPNEKRERERENDRSCILMIDKEILQYIFFSKIFFVTLISREDAFSEQDACPKQNSGKLDKKVGIQKKVSLAARPTLVQ